MVSQLTLRRQAKQMMLKQMIRQALDLLTLPKGSLDQMQMSKLKTTLKNLTDLYERSRPPE